jgi:hypothetical protein
MPDLASYFDAQIESARRDMVLSSADGSAPGAFYRELRERLVARFSSDLPQSNAEFLAQKCIADWLQQCPLDFEPAP